MPRRRVAVVGAGVAGLTAAKNLTRSFEVAVFDKGRGVGGRLATRRIGNATFDHGAQFITTHTPEFAETVAGWERVGVAKPWFRGRVFGLVRRRLVVFPGRGDNRFAQLHVDDAAKVLVTAAQKRWTGTAPCGDEENVTWNEFFDVLISYAPRPCPAGPGVAGGWGRRCGRSTPWAVGSDPREPRHRSGVEPRSIGDRNSAVEGAGVGAQVCQRADWHSGHPRRGGGLSVASLGVGLVMTRRVTNLPSAWCMA